MLRLQNGVTDYPDLTAFASPVCITPDAGRKALCGMKSRNATFRSLLDAVTTTGGGLLFYRREISPPTIAHGPACGSRVAATDRR